MNRKFPITAVALTVLILAGVVFWESRPLWPAGKSKAGSPGADRTEAGIPSTTSSSPALPLSTQLDALYAELQAAKDPATTRQILAKLRNLLDSLPANVASREVQAFLATNKDASTQLDLTIKPGGALGDASSLRVFLLDYLGLVDPQAAGVVASQILAQYTTPDEWAVSLRNYAWANPGQAGQDYLKTKAHELLANPAWAKDPSVGFLEAFDTIVYTHDTTMAPELSTLVRDKANPAAAHAAFLTMDRLVIAEPTTMMKQIIAQPDLMAGHEQTRADFVARADLGQPDQRALVEQYLLDPTRSPQELSTFAAIFPNANYMISDNLLTTVQTPTASALVQLDQAALKTVEQWQRDPRFEQLLPLLSQMHQRIGGFVKEASANTH